MDGSLNVAIAFVAGVASFIAPCTLALVPAFVVYLAGFTLSEADRASPGRARRAAVLNVMAFALGFTAVFVLVGSSLGALSQAVGGQAVWLNRVGGILIIAFGLVALGLLRAPPLKRDLGLNADFARRLKYAGSLLVGGTFAVSWVPCVGPILAGILVLAGTSGSPAAGALLLSVYAAGIMLPFIAAGVFSGWTTGLLRRFGRTLQYTTAGGGLLLIALGIVVFTNLMPVIAGYLPLGVTTGI